MRGKCVINDALAIANDHECNICVFINADSICKDVIVHQFI